MKGVGVFTLVFGFAVAAPAWAATLCPHVVLAVCAVDPDKAQLQTFNNACEAKRAGFKWLHNGKCNGEFCPRLCIAGRGVVAKGVVSGAERTYENMCWAEKDWAAFEHYGACPQ